MFKDKRIPEWPHKMPYEIFLEHVIEAGHTSLNEFRKRTKLGNFVYKHGYNGLYVCRGKDIQWLHDAFRRAEERYNKSTTDGTYRMGLDNRRKAIGQVFMCVCAAYGVEHRPGFITAKARRLTETILTIE